MQEKAPEIVYWPPMVEHLFGRSRLSLNGPYVRHSQRPRRHTEFFERGPASRVVGEFGFAAGAVRTMQEVYGKSLARTSFTLVMLGIAGAMALALGIIGIYGVISYTVSQRRAKLEFAWRSGRRVETSCKWL